MKKRNIVIFLVLGLVLALLGFGGYTVFNDDDPYATQALPELPVPPLRELSENHDIDLGMFASLKYLRERPYSEIINTEFDSIIVDGEPNWQFENFTLRPSRDDYDFTQMDQVFAFADQNDMPLRVQHLLWGDEKWLPEWLRQGNYSDSELLQIIREHITTVGERYRGKVREYTVVNEAFSRELETGGNKDWWGERLGRSYIDEAFRTARAADPDAVLLLNDFGNETEGEISNNMLAYILDARQRGVPIDGLGMQMHIDGSNPPSKEKVVANMRRFAAEGIPVYVTEFDVNMHFFEGSDEEKFRAQADVYRDMLGACIEVGAENCPHFGFLGLVDRQSWYGGIGMEDADPLMFYDDYTPKPAFYAVREVLEGR